MKQAEPPVVETPVEIDEVGEDDEASEVEQEEGLEPKNKEMTPLYDTYPATFGATSFEQLDQARAANLVALETRVNANDLQSIIGNIFYDDTVTDKAKAIASATDEFRQRMGTPMKKKSALQELIESVKAKITSAGMNDLPDSAFAYIEPGGKKDAGGKTTPRSLRHFPVHDAAHTRNALARASQSPFGSKAMPKIHAAAKKFGIKVGSKETELRIYKDNQGDWRWLGIFSNNFEDTSEEIITEAAHKEFIVFLDEHPEHAPFFVPWHTLGAARKNRADFWDYVDGFMLIGGKLEADEAQALQKAQKDAQLGMSHGFFPLEHDPKNEKHITKYRTFEVSDLPLQNAANPFTGINVIMKEVAMGFNAVKREYLVGQIGEDAVKELEKGLKQGGNILQLLGVPSKEAAPSDAEEVEGTEEVPAIETDEEPATAEVLATLTKAISDQLGLPALSALLENHDKELKTLAATNKAQAETIKKLTKSDDEKIAEKIAPASSLFWMQKGNRPSQSKANIVKKDDEVDTEDEGTEEEVVQKDKLVAPWLEEAIGPRVVQ